MTEIEEYYNKFNEEKRLNSRHGQVEFRVTMKYIDEMLEIIKSQVRGNHHDTDNQRISDNQENLDNQENSDNQKNPDNQENSAISIIDIGAGTGRYSVALAKKGYDVTAVELVKHNLGILKAKNSSVKAYQGNAMKLKRFADESFDLTLLFGPMYHLISKEDKLKALSEAKRVTKPGGIIMVAYVMNEYSVVTYAFKEKHIMECLENDMLTADYRTKSDLRELYDYVRIEDINELNAEMGLERIKIISPDGPANYIRPFLNQLSDEEFEEFIKYQMATCERQDIIGAGAHTVDILKKC